MDNKISLETPKELKQGQVDEAPVINNSEFSIKQEQDYADSKINKIDNFVLDYFDNYDLQTQDFPEIIDFKQEIDGTLDIKQKIDEIDHAEQLQDIFFKRECDVNYVKEEIDIEYGIDKENTCYQCYECDLQFELRCSYQVHLDNCHKQSETQLNHSKEKSKHDTGKKAKLNLTGAIEGNTGQINIKHGLNTENGHEDEVFESSKKSSDLHKNATRNANKFNCEICQKTFRHKRNLVNHTNAIHDKVKFKCEICQKPFSYKHSIAKHVRAVHDQVKFSCEICEKSFSCKDHLVKHTYAVHDEVKFNCEICHKAFSYRTSLTVHVNAVHKSMRYECRTCRQIFLYKYILHKHVKAVHDKVKYECEICHETYSFKSSLGAHVNRVHINKFKYECRVCHKSFASKGGLDNHVKDGHDEIRHECKMCDKVFRLRNSLCRHVRTKHRENKINKI